MATYPNGILVKADVTNEVDDVDQNDHNILKGEIIALQTYVGTSPQGSAADLTTRLARSIGTDGVFQKGAAFPATTYDGQPFWRSDEPAFYVYSTTTGTWTSSQNLSNLAFEYSGATYGSGFAGEASATSGVVTGGSFRYLAGAYANVYGTVWTSKFKKVAGMTNITVHHKTWRHTSGDGYFRLWVGTIGGSAQASATPFPAWASFVLGISGLTNGTTYDVVAEVKGSTAQAVCISDIVGIVS